MSRYINVNPQDLLDTKVSEYMPQSYRHFGIGALRKQPLFTQQTIRDMEVDPRVKFGLSLIKGPLLSKAKFRVTSDNDEVRKFVIKLINSFWLNGAMQALKAVEWGFSGSEVLYREDEKNGQITYKGLKDFDSSSVRVVTNNGNRVGILIDHFLTTKMQQGKAVYLGGPKGFHHVHARQFNPHYGRSRLFGAHIPYNEIWQDGGYRDIRQMWFYKNAFEGGTLYHPRKMYELPDGRRVHAQDYAQEMIEKKRTGAVWTLPNDTDNSGKREWEHIPAKGNTIPAGLFEYYRSLREEILEAMGIPYEVIEASGNEGFGSSSGREIPETAFYSILQEQLNWLIFDFVEQIARPLVQINAALGRLPYDTFDVLSYPLDANPEELEFTENRGSENSDQKQQQAESNSKIQSSNSDVEKNVGSQNSDSKENSDSLAVAI